jgi:hypothetical protein
MRSFGSNDIEPAPQNPGMRIGMYSQTPPRNASSPDAANGVSMTFTACAPGAENCRGRNTGKKIDQVAFTIFL